MTRHRVIGQLSRVVAAAVVLPLLAGCNPQTQYRPGPAVLQSAVDCSTATGMMANPSAPGASQKGRVPDGFVPVDVVRCTWELPVLSAHATTSPDAVVREDHLSGDYGPLLAVLAGPSDRGGRVSCLDYAEILPELWLVDAAGAAVNVAWPVDSCGFSKPGTAAALETLTVASSTTVPAKEPAA